MKSIITISRQSGSGGRTIAKQLAEELGYKCYDWEIIERVAAETGFDTQYVAKCCENTQTTSNFWYAVEQGNFPYYGGNFSPNDEIMKTMRELIEKLANEGNCVFVGRAADYILRDRKDALHVFIYADAEYRADRIINRYKEEVKDIFKEIKDRDKKRKMFYSNYTGREWGAMSNYSLSLNGSDLDVNTCVGIIKMAMGK